MSVEINGKIFSKGMARVFDSEVIKCPDCGFEFSTKHELTNAEGCYECPTCKEANLEIENKELREHRDNLNSIIFDMEKEIERFKSLIEP